MMPKVIFKVGNIKQNQFHNFRFFNLLRLANSSLLRPTQNQALQTFLLPL